MDSALDHAWLDGKGLAALDLACQQGQVSTVKAFINARPPATALRNAAGESPLYAAVRCVAAASKSLELATILVEEECDHTMRNHEGKTALEVAREQPLPNAPLIDYLASLCEEQGVDMPLDDGGSSPVRSRRPRASGLSLRKPPDARLDPIRMASVSNSNETPNFKLQISIPMPQAPSPSGQRSTMYR